MHLQPYEAHGNWTEKPTIHTTAIYAYLHVCAYILKCAINPESVLWKKCSNRSMQVYLPSLLEELIQNNQPTDRSTIRPNNRRPVGWIMWLHVLVMRLIFTWKREINKIQCKFFGNDFFFNQHTIGTILTIMKRKSSNTQKRF